MQNPAADSALNAIWTTLDVLTLRYHSLHWLASGVSFPGDHALFGDLYTETQGAPDALVEKAIATTGFAPDVDAHATDVVAAMAEKAEPLAMESALVGTLIPAAISAVETMAGSLGLVTHLQEMASNATTRAYKIERRGKVTLA